jgi:hypothetical protein
MTRVKPPRPAALPRQQTFWAARFSEAELAVPALVSLHLRKEVDRLVEAMVGVETVPTLVTGIPQVRIVVLVSGSHMTTMLFPRKGCRG